MRAPQTPPRGRSARAARPPSHTMSGATRRVCDARRARAADRAHPRGNHGHTALLRSSIMTGDLDMVALMGQLAT